MVRWPSNICQKTLFLWLLFWISGWGCDTWSGCEAVFNKAYLFFTPEDFLWLSPLFMRHYFVFRRLVTLKTFKTFVLLKQIIVFFSFLFLFEKHPEHQKKCQFHHVLLEHTKYSVDKDKLNISLWAGWGLHQLWQGERWGTLCSQCIQLISLKHRLKNFKTIKTFTQQIVRSRMMVR